MSAVENELIIDGNGDLSDNFIRLQDLLLPDYAIEVGAHAAEFSQFIASHLNISAVAFEANQKVYEKFKNTFNDSRIKYLNYAISDSDSEVSIMVHEDPLAGNNSIIYRNGVESMIDEYKVKSYSLDSYFKDITFKSACLWIDVEGANREVLTGAEKTLERVSSIFIETEDHEYWKDQWLTSEVVAFLNSKGFDVFAEEFIYDAQRNIIFTRREQ